MSIGVLIVIYSTVAIKLRDAAGLAAITFLCIAIGYDSEDTPLITTLSRLFDTIIGIVVALLVNVITLPKIKEEGKKNAKEIVSITKKSEYIFRPSKKPSFDDNKKEPSETPTSHPVLKGRLK